MPHPFRSLLDEAACRREALASIAQGLRSEYAPHLAEPLPEQLKILLRRLERHDDPPRG